MERYVTMGFVWLMLMGDMMDATLLSERFPAIPQWVDTVGAICFILTVSVGCWRIARGSAPHHTEGR